MQPYNKGDPKLDFELCRVQGVPKKTFSSTKEKYSKALNYQKHLWRNGFCLSFTSASFKRQLMCFNQNRLCFICQFKTKIYQMSWKAASCCNKVSLPKYRLTESISIISFYVVKDFHFQHLLSIIV